MSDCNFSYIFGLTYKFDKTLIERRLRMPVMPRDKYYTKLSRYEIRQRLCVVYEFTHLTNRVTFEENYCRGLPFGKRNTKNLDSFLKRLGTSVEKIGMLHAKLFVIPPLRYLIQRPRDAYRKPRRNLRKANRLSLTIYPTNNLWR